MPGQSSGVRLWMLKLVLVVGALVVSLATVEVLLRVAGIQHPRTSQRHEFRGTAYRPHAEWVQSAEGHAHIRINSEGFRDDEWTITKPADTIRIAVLGDSYVDAVQVEEPDRFTERLGGELSSCHALGGLSLEVMNFGMSGYGTAQELLTYRHNARKYSPDLVVLAFLPHNDLRNNSPTLQGDPGRPYFVLEEDELVFDDSFRETSFHRQPWWKRLGNMGREFFRVAQVADNTRRRILRRAEGRNRERLLSERSSRLQQAELGLDDMSYLEPTDPAWQETWRTTEAIILAMRDEVHREGAGFVVMTLTAGDQVHPDPEERQRFADTLGVSDLLYTDRRIAQLGTEGGFPVVNLAAAFQKHAEAKNTHLHGFDNPGSGHWNQSGHRLAAELLAADVCRNSHQLIPSS